MTDDENDASKQIDRRIEELGDWRGELLRKVRAVIKAADPDDVFSPRTGRTSQGEPGLGQ